MDFLVTIRSRLAVTLVETAELVVFEGEVFLKGVPLRSVASRKAALKTSASRTSIHGRKKRE
jgi:hypothetical protein